MSLRTLLLGGSFAALGAFGLVWLGLDVLALDYAWLYLFAGGLTMAVAIGAWLLFPGFPQIVPQHKRLILRGRYWLYYALTFMGGARRDVATILPNNELKVYMRFDDFYGKYVMHCHNVVASNSVYSIRTFG